MVLKYADEKEDSREVKKRLVHNSKMIIGHIRHDTKYGQKSPPDTNAESPLPYSHSTHSLKSLF